MPVMCNHQLKTISKIGILWYKLTLVPLLPREAFAISFSQCSICPQILIKMKFEQFTRHMWVLILSKAFYWIEVLFQMSNSPVFLLIHWQANQEHTTFSQPRFLNRWLKAQKTGLGVLLRCLDAFCPPCASRQDHLCLFPKNFQQKIFLNIPNFICFRTSLLIPNMNFVWSC